MHETKIFNDVKGWRKWAELSEFLVEKAEECADQKGA